MKAVATDRKGFTLPEVLIALAILAILVSLAAPGMAGMMDRHRVATASRQLITDLQYAKTRAVTENTSYRVNFDVGNGRYRVERSDGTSTGPWRTLADETPGVSLTKNFTGNVVVFGQIGEAMDSTNAPFAVEAVVTFTAATGAARAVSIASSGRISVT
jgi:prepilin-type N-terminal cleavage/methylation domain-containing protein